MTKIHSWQSVLFWGIQPIHFYSTPSTEGVESTRGNSVCVSVRLSVITCSDPVPPTYLCLRGCYRKHQKKCENTDGHCLDSFSIEDEPNTAKEMG